jgi:hypothetical protein
MLTTNNGGKMTIKKPGQVGNRLRHVSTTQL